MPHKLEVTLTLDNVWDSKGANWLTLSEGGYADTFGDNSTEFLEYMIIPNPNPPPKYSQIVQR